MKYLSRRQALADDACMAQTTIAIVADCDDTLAPDTTRQLLELCGVHSGEFFREIAIPMVKEGWDPSLAYMRGMVGLTENEAQLFSAYSGEDQ